MSTGGCPLVISEALLTVMMVLTVSGRPAAGRGPYTSGHTSPFLSTDPSEEDASDHCGSFRSAIPARLVPATLGVKQEGV